MSNLSGKVALVTGSGRGIGQQIALKLARACASVVVNDLDAAPAAETVEKIKADGGQAVAVVGSVLDEGFADRFVGTAVETFGGLHIIGYVAAAITFLAALGVALFLPARARADEEPFTPSADEDLEPQRA